MTNGQNTISTQITLRANQQLFHIKVFVDDTKMPICAEDCDCRWCKLSDMSCHPLFKERINALLLEYERIVASKPKHKLLPDD